MARSGDRASLYLVATPVGNLEDITLRALRVLSEVGLVAAEDTRHTRKLLSHHGIQAELLSYREQNHERAAGRILENLQRGDDVALVADAGTPGISDPGQRLVEEVIEAGFWVVPLPGACAAVCALAASGLATDRFLFKGFLPRKPGALRRAIEDLAGEPSTLVFYESPRRLGATLEAMAEVLGDRPAVVCRELTKVHETFDRATLSELAARYADGARGEITLVVAGSQGGPARIPEELRTIAEALRTGRRLAARDAARLLGRLSGAGRNAVYALLMGGEQEDPDG